MNRTRRTTQPEGTPRCGEIAATESGVANRARHLAASLAIGIALAPAAGSCWAQSNKSLRTREAQITPFRLVSIDGYLQARYTTDSTSSAALAGGGASQARQTNLSEELYVMTHSYVYHPSLLSLDIGGGPVIDRGNYNANGIQSSSNRQLFNLSARATILRDKPYNGDLFYERQNQTQSVGPAQQIQTNNTSYGGRFSLLSPVTPVPMQVDLTRTNNQGQGAGQVIEDRIDQLRVKLDANVGHWGTSTFQYVATRQDSSSGSSALPIQTSNSSNQHINIDTRARFGEDNKYDLNNLIAFNNQVYTVGQGAPTHLRDFGFGLDLRAQNTEALRTYARYNLSTSRLDDLSTTLNSASVGANYQFDPTLSGSLDAHGQANRSTQVKSTNYGIDGSAQYRPKLPLGLATFTYNFAYSKFDQQASVLQTRLIGEHVTLSGTSLVSLNRQQIATASVVVSNLTRSQTFVEGFDYVLSVVGQNLRIQRLITGNIVDGQEVLVDYEFATGGSYASTRLDQTISANWSLNTYLRLYARYLNSAVRLDSGTPTAPLNPATSVLIGAQTDFPLTLAMQYFLVGASAEHEIRDEVISPYRRTSLDAYAQMDLPYVRSGNVRLGLRQMRVNYIDSPNSGVNLVGYELRLRSRVGYGVDISGELSHERDTGAPVARERTSVTARAQWRLRNLSWTFDMTRLREIQGLIDQSRTYAQFLLRRDF